MDVSGALKILKQEGYKLTDKREEILVFFDKHKRYVSAKEVLEFMKTKHPGLSFDTIYRNLSLFATLHILEATELQGEKHFRLSCDHNTHHHHFICTDCGKTKTIHACPMAMLGDSLEHFDITGHKFEVYGTCNECTKH